MTSSTLKGGSGTHRGQTVTVVCEAAIFLVMFLPAQLIQSAVMFSSLVDRDYHVSLDTYLIQQVNLYLGPNVGCHFEIYFV